MKTKGYTLIEILITLSLLSVIGMGALFFTRTFVQKNEQAAQVTRLVGALQYARMAAIHQGKTVLFCGSSDLKHCDGHWHQGQVVKQKDQVLRVFYKTRLGDYWVWKSNFGKNQQLEFSSLGFTHGQQGSFYYHTREKVPIYRVVVSHSGHIRVEKI